MHGVCHLKGRRKIPIYPRWSIRRRVRLRSGICSRNLFILFPVFMVCGIEEKKEAEEHGIQPSQGAISFSFRRLLISRGHQFLCCLRDLSVPSFSFLFRCPLSSNVYFPLSNERASLDCKLAGIPAKKLRVPSSGVRGRACAPSIQHHPSALLYGPLTQLWERRK